jgi:adenine-specific DNA-methyltransferase
MLTKRQKQILDFIQKFIDKNDYAPSLEEIARRFKLNSASTVHQHIEALREKGYLSKEDNQPRTIQPANRRSDSLVSIPLLGAIAAGQPIETIEGAEVISVLKSQMATSGRHYALRVRGGSMIDEGIFDGDTVVVREQPTAENGETVVAVINNEGTLKKIYKERGGFRLQPANPNVKPIFTKELTIKGKVTSIIRNLERADEMMEFAGATTKYIEETDIKHRKSLGQYFTPRSIREALVYRLPSTIREPRVLDPGCGTGEFLITAKKYFNNPELNGWDVDKKLVGVASQLVPGANITHQDSLENKDYGQYDIVIGNPPYYEFSPSEKIRVRFESIISGRTNIFSLFIYQGLRWLKDGGYLAYVVPPSMNNGAYFQRLREFIVQNANIEYLHVLESSKIFNGAQQSTMLLVLKKGPNRGDYVFKKNGILIFSEDVKYLEKSFRNKPTLYDLGYRVKTGQLVWNQNRQLLTHESKNAIPLIWAHNITTRGLQLPVVNDKKPQYAKWANYSTGPAIVVNRISGSVKSAQLRAAIIPTGMKFVAENHVNVIFPPNKRQLGMNIVNTHPKVRLRDIAQQISAEEQVEIIRNLTGNTQVSKTELEKLFPINARA